MKKYLLLKSWAYLIEIVLVVFIYFWLWYFFKEDKLKQVLVSQYVPVLSVLLAFLSVAIAIVIYITTLSNTEFGKYLDHAKAFDTFMAGFRFQAMILVATSCTLSIALSFSDNVWVCNILFFIVLYAYANAFTMVKNMVDIFNLKIKFDKMLAENKSMHE